MYDNFKHQEPNIAKYRQISPDIARYRQISPDIAKYRQISPNIAKYRKCVNNSRDPPYNTLPDPSSDIPLIKLLRKDLIVRVELFLQFDRLQELLLDSSLGFLSKKRVKSGASVV